MTRRLAAVLMADVVDYSRLMSADETGTLAALRAHRAKVFDPAIDAFSGRVVKWMGDGVLVEFVSVVNAVEAALRIQKDSIAADGLIRLRVGVSLGDIIIEEDDIFGEGVNLAARLEAMAAPDGVCISGMAHDSIGGRIDVSFEDAGEQEVKGIARPVRVFRWPATGEVSRHYEMPSVAVIPFGNLSTDPEDTYFSHGIAEDIATDLSKMSGLIVIAGSATHDYKGQGKSSAVVARELGVRYVLDGSVRRGAGRVRINARLMDGDTASQLWAERFDGELADIFDLQDRITERIVSTLSIVLTRAEQERAFRKDPKSLQAYDLVLQANAYHHRFTKEDNDKAIALYARALALDPTYAPAHAGYAWAVNHLANQEWGDNPQKAKAEALKHAETAVALDSGLAKAHLALADVYCWSGQQSLAVSEGRKASELDPTNADIRFAYAFFLNISGNPEEGCVQAELALRYNPIHARGAYYETLGIGRYFLRQYDAAALALEEGLARNNGYDGLHQWIAATYAQLGRLEEARKHAQELERLKPGVTLSHLAQRLPYKNQADFEHLFEGLRQAGVPE